MIGAGYVRMGEVAGTLLEISGTPALVPRREREKGWVTGELFNVSPDHLQALDAMGESSHETGGSNYQRVRMQIYLPGSPILQGEAWVWQWIDPASTAPIVRSGDWTDVSHPRPAPWCTLIAGLCLVGFFVSLGAVNSAFPALGTVRLYRQILFLFVAMVPIVACVTAWWGLRRRERYEFFTVLIVVVAALASLPLGLAIVVEIISRFIGLF